MSVIWDALVHTPWWVYVLFVYLMVISFQASQPRIVSLKVLFIIPLIFLVMSVQTLFAAFQPSFFTVAIWILTIAVGALLGFWQIARWDIKVDKQKKLLAIPGSWSTLFIILAIFAAKYYFGYELSVDPTRAQDTVFEILLLSVSGICTGLFLGRLLCFLYRYKTANHTSL